MKRIVTIQDISCIGKCSLTAALPIISCFGVETAVIPTAVLSNHTAFDDFSFFDLTDEIRDVSEKWEKQGQRFDAIYTGYMGSAGQIAIVGDFFDKFRDDGNLIIVDPAMADNGKLYAGFSEDFPDIMEKLIRRADVILPNMTEAHLLLHRKLPEGRYDEAYIKELLASLTELGASRAVITGVSFDEDLLGAAGYDAASGRYFSCFNKRSSRNFHGTGDIFASVITGALVKGADLEEAVHMAVDFTRICIEYTERDTDAGWYGVNFEEALPELIEMMKGKTYGRK